ncbi:MAG: sugar phosphate isomerase/epimerase [Spirochaetes bacterium]|nr:sugar phosphate isomerase/epimerase [Spirochaetota bacterium]MBU0956083.1 sugar phosphate isomerase/epimerase [Spirochaetota bacterium]
MTIAYQNALHPAQPLAAFINTALAERVQWFELFFDRLRPADLTAADRQALGVDLASAGLGLSVHAPLLDYRRSENREIMQEVAACSQRLGAAFLVVHLPEIEASSRFFREELAAVFPALKLSVENARHPDGHYSTGFELIECFKQHGSWLGGCTFDSGHARLAGGKPETAKQVCPAAAMLGQILAAGLPLCSLHIHDNKGDQDNHLPVGCGDIDFSGIAAALRRHGLSVPMVIEHWDGREESRKQLEGL